MVEVTLVYWGSRRSDGPKARAKAKARLTPTQVVVSPGWQIEQLRSGARIMGGQGTYRFERKTGFKIPRYSLGGGWEIEKIGEEVVAS